ncbi:MAG: hypothetical protein IT250_17345 [Chitinophagaceae bacterium]|nr:hypothetical protein [Chitinophagaceae bacterium]
MNGANLTLFTNSVNELKVDLPIEKSFRVIKLNKKDNRIRRFIKVVYFNLFVTFHLFRLRPASIFYFETTSSFPVFIYLLFYSSKARLLIHYHEYTSPDQYKQGMLLDRIWHFFEIKFLYKKASWISQTNRYRIDLFLRDYRFDNTQLLKVLPNFPPASWIVSSNGVKGRTKSAPYRIIQLGSISTRHMYAKELFDWIREMDGLFLLDIYSFNTQPDIILYLKKLNCSFIQIKGNIVYDEIPGILSGYDIGVVTYKATTENVIYCASNKLFEYLSAGLDVWVSKAMLGSAPYMRADCYPKVSFVDFENLSGLNWKELIDRENLSYKPSPYYMEMVYDQLLEYLK